MVRQWCITLRYQLPNAKHHCLKRSFLHFESFSETFRQKMNDCWKNKRLGCFWSFCGCDINMNESNLTTVNLKRFQFWKIKKISLQHQKFSNICAVCIWFTHWAKYFRWKVCSVLHWRDHWRRNGDRWWYTVKSLIRDSNLTWLKCNFKFNHYLDWSRNFYCLYTNPHCKTKKLNNIKNDWLKIHSCQPKLSAFQVNHPSQEVKLGLKAVTL